MARTVAAAAMANLVNMEVSPLGCGRRRDAVRRWEEVSPRRFPADMGRFVKKGSQLILQVHYHPWGKEEQDLSQSTTSDLV